MTDAEQALVQDRYRVLEAKVRALEAERDQLREERDRERTHRELTAAEVRGMRDFLSGQPRELPRDQPEGQSTDAQRGFHWMLGYDVAREGPLFREMLQRADASANRAAATARTLVEVEAERDQLKADIDAAHEVLHDGAPIQQGTSRETLHTLTLVERIREVFDTCGYLDDKVTAAEAERDHRQAALVALRQQVEHLAETWAKHRGQWVTMPEAARELRARLTPAPSQETAMTNEEAQAAFVPGSKKLQ